MRCPSCGTENSEDAVSCTRCGVLLRAKPAPPPPPPPPAVDATMGGLIPLKNPNALAADYLGIFSFFPLLGAVLGVVALILGIKGLQLAHRHPEVKAATHAWVGIVAGGLFGLFYLFWLVMIVVSMATHHAI